jgi:hypothetical protein
LLLQVVVVVVASAATLCSILVLKSSPSHSESNRELSWETIVIMNIGSSSSPSSVYNTEVQRSTFPSAYYDPFYPNGGPTTWSSYPPPTYQSQASQSVTSGPTSCLLPSGPKGLVGPHFTPVHHQRRKRRVLFTQAQVRVMMSAYFRVYDLFKTHDDPYHCILIWMTLSSTPLQLIPLSLSQCFIWKALNQFLTSTLRL